jgi:hypothetical protein
VAARRLRVDPGTFVAGSDVAVFGDGSRPLARVQANHLGGLVATVEDHETGGPLLAVEGEGVAGRKRFFCPAQQLPKGGPEFDRAMADGQLEQRVAKQTLGMVQGFLEARGVEPLRETVDRRHRLVVFALAALAVLEAATLAIVALVA